MLIMNINSKVAQRLKEIRSEKNILQKYVAEGLGISENAYSRIENGYTQLTIANLYIICERLNVTVQHVLDLFDNTTINNNKNLVMNNVNHGHLHINLTPEEFQHFYQKIKEEKGSI